MRADQPIPREVCVEPRARRAASRAGCWEGAVAGNPSQGVSRTCHMVGEFPYVFDRKR